MTLRDIDAHVFSTACAIIGVSPATALTDPTWTLRVAGSVPVEVGQAFADVVCVHGRSPDLARMGADESALATALLWVKVVDRVRGEIRARSRSNGVAIPVPEKT